MPKSASIKSREVPYLEYPSSNNQDNNRRKCLIFYIPGNPGLISYYKPFFTTLRQLLDEKEAKPDSQHAFHIYGQNLLGFHDGDHEPSFGTKTEDGHLTEPFLLEDQIRYLSETICQVNTVSGPFDEVIIMGHSVGSYMALEIFHRHHMAVRNQDEDNQLRKIRFKAGILLFPTVAHIAKSGSGQKLDLIRTTPFLDTWAHQIAKGFVNLCPSWFLNTVVRKVMRFPEHAAEATLGFLASKDGIWQAIHMGKNEMETITEEKWSEDLWEIQDIEDERGGEEEELDASKFFFYFAQKDHWVADECRDEFIEKRRRHEKGKTRIFIDEEKTPHAFCIHHSEKVAERVNLWINQISF
ncbi:lipid droplet-associated hydrolase [Podospora fimiseda]|uniref:Lipid droplet-associated hydrolase n=1 Tax=Podospora fimiseda TaxID=252190 RepID=A0AAN7H2L9_9PEZI|nr:lipid droplet-associated hydrolase [Podospora fimiseda]